jgi:CRISPR/Cas system-associated protein Cas5 (RAMP superfamily)
MVVVFHSSVKFNETKLNETYLYEVLREYLSTRHSLLQKNDIASLQRKAKMVGRHKALGSVIKVQRW